MVIEHMERLIATIPDRIKGEKEATRKQLYHLASLCGEKMEMDMRYLICKHHKLTTDQAHYLIEGLRMSQN